MVKGFVERSNLNIDRSTGKVRHPIPGRSFTIHEGTSGNTGISLGLIGNYFGLSSRLYLNDDLSDEKVGVSETSTKH